MLYHEDLTGEKVAHVIRDAAAHHLKITLTVQHQNRWLTFASRLLTLGDAGLQFEMPLAVEDIKAAEFLPGKECNISFRSNSYRYFLTAAVSPPARAKGLDGKPTDCLSIRLPEQISQLNRRAFDRLDIPASQSVRATIWSNPSHNPSWAGKILNMSMGGFQMRAPDSVLSVFEPGDLVWAKVSFSLAAQPLLISCHYRYGRRDGTMCLLGLEFILRADAESDQATYKTVQAKLDEFRAMG